MTASRRIDWWLYAILGIAVLARVTRLSDELWPDETYNWYVAKDGWLVAIDRIRQDFFPPFYSVFLAFWIEGFGASPTSLRIPGIAFGLVLVFLIFKLVTQAGLPRVARYAALLVAISPFFSTIHQVVRPFALDTTVIVAALFFAYQFLQSVTERRNVPLSVSVGLVVSLSLAVHTNHGSVFMVFVSFWVLAWMCCRDLNAVWTKELKHLVVLFGVVFILWVPELPFIFEQRERSVATSFVEHQPNLANVFSVFGDYLGGFNLWSIQLVGVALVIVPGLWGIIVLRRTSRLLANFLGLLFLVYILFLLVLFGFDPVFGRVLQRSQWLGVIFLVFTAAGYSSILPSSVMVIWQGKYLQNCVRVGVFAFFLLVQLQAHRNTVSMAREGYWDSFGPLIQEDVQQTDIVAAIRWVFHASVRYYLPGTFRDEQFQVSQETSQWTVDQIGEYTSFLSEAHCAQGAERVWMFVAGGENVRQLKEQNQSPLLVRYNEDGRIALMLFPLNCH